MSDVRQNDFETVVVSPECGLLGDCWAWLRHNKKWWLMPILSVLLVFGLLLLFSGTAAAPFLYTLF
jgi:drug/metabolite transporter superfamily protein YnfA